MSSYRKETETFSFKRLLIAFAALSLVFSLNTCDMPMGLGDPIDWEPPVLTLDPGYPNPLYVRLGTMLAGTVTDNIGVERVILRNANTGVEMFKANMLPNNRWEIALDFTAEQNGEKIAVEVVAFDRVGNSGDVSIAAITLIIDIRPPIIKDIKISRTAVRDAYLETYHELFDLERTDPYGLYGTLSANANKYQNGFFNIKGEVSEQETRIEVLGLSIYDANRDPNTPLLLTPGESRFSLPKSGGSDYAPVWLIKEEDILNAGDLLWSNYKTNYYENGSRYYYRVAIYAIDRSGNEGESLIIEDEGFFCIWEKGDEPKGIIDRLVGTVVTKGATIPIEFFDDDTLDWAYVGLLTQDQWEGIKEIAPGTKIPDGSNDEKLQWLKEKLLAGDTIYDWKFDKKPLADQQKVADQIAGKTFDERIIYIQTGNDDNDTGAYVLFTLTADKKLDPHTGIGPSDTNKPRWKGRAWYVDVIDENAPLIVFDTVNTNEVGYDPDDHTGSPNKEPIVAAQTGDSPEENTFPKLTEGTDGNGGQYFEINGYTLRAYREDQEIQSSVVKFRMAWIPFGMDNGHPDNYITAVQNALRGANYPNSFNTLPAGIQHWEFVPEPGVPGPGQGEFILGTPEEIGESKFKKQVFRKRFDVLGGADDLKAVYNNFTYNGSRENETKLFVFYAEDNVGHEVFRQLRLLGNKTPPDLAVYDITGKDGIILADEPPNLNNSDPEKGSIYFNEQGNIDGPGRALYRDHLFAYQPYGYTVMKPVSLSGTTILLTDADRTEPYQAYPRDTIIKYWVMAEKSGDLAVSSIKMEDITYSDDRRDVGYYNAGDRSLSYIEMLPEVTQRVFLFTAKDTLDNEVRIQRTVAVTNAAVLNNITTATQSGDYGITKIDNGGNAIDPITLQANFSNLVRWTGSNPPLLNVRYKEGGIDGSQVVRQIATKTPADTSVLFLEFDFIIEEGYTGDLQTMHYGMGVPAGDDNNLNNRPITLPAGTKILDDARGDDAFTPRNVSGFDWTAAGQGPKNSLQGSKTITLDGIRPIITGFWLDPPSGKILHSDSHPGYYYKADETIQFTLEANKPIYTSGDPTIGLDIGGVWRPAAWLKSDGATKMVFSVLVSNDLLNNTNTPGESTVSAIRLNNVSTIVDGVGNAFLGGGEPLPVTLDTHFDIHIDTKQPAWPGTTLNGSSVGSPTTLNYSANPILAIPENTSGESAPVAKTEYSLNNGVTWKEFSPTFEPDPAWTSGSPDDNTLRILPGQWTLATRYIDRAGNDGAITSQPLHVNDNFPALKSITAVQTDGFYPRDGSTLEFDLAFEEPVWTQTAANVTITLANRNAVDNTATTRTQQISATAVAQANAATTIRFAWIGITLATNKEMLDGLYVSAVNFSGLRDRFGNVGGSNTVTATISGSGAGATVGDILGCPNLNGAGLKVDCIAPVISTRSPDTGEDIPGAGNNKNRTITLTFNERMIKGSGTITVRPRGNYAIPPVFENNGYYLGTNGTRYSSPSAVPSGTYSTYVDGFYDIYNKTTTTTQKNGLAQSSNANPNMNDLTLNTRSSQTAGPYIRTTHGLKEGAGYTGNWTTSANGPNPEGTRMVPDTTTKWVLDYRYLIDSTTQTEVTNIRATLTAIKFRWQEIDVTSGNVSINTTGNGRVVTINLPEPLLDGLEWDLYYPAGTFTDEAGNNAPAIASAAYWFWSSGVQTPVIRVNRRSYDARTSNWAAPLGRAYNNPALTTDWNNANFAVTNDDGWSIFDFNTVHYRIETETPNATLTSGVYRGTNANNGAVNGAWTDNVGDANTNVTTDSAWSATGTTSGTWIMPNLIRRAGTGTGANRISYTVVENGITLTRQGDNTYQGFRSYNKDPTKTELDTYYTSNNAAFNATNRQGIITFSASTTVPSYEASKNYIIARATRGEYNATGYEGVFRSVIMLNQASFGGNVGGANQDNNPTMVQGSNIRNGMPSIAGFPVRDAEETGDNRYIKLFYRVAYTANTSGQLLWVSTEIVSQWYELNASRLRTDNSATGGTHQSAGEVNNYLTAGYGDLTYSYNQR
jgi:hypothetical protein